MFFMAPQGSGYVEQKINKLQFFKDDQKKGNMGQPVEIEQGIYDK